MLKVVSLQPSILATESQLKGKYHFGRIPSRTLSTSLPESHMADW